MSRRRLETAIQAGKAIDEGKAIPEAFHKAEAYYTHRFEDVRSGVYSLQYSFDGSSLAVGYGDGGVEILSTETGELQHEVRRHRLNGLAVTSIRFCPKQQNLCLAASSEGKLSACDITDGSCRDLALEPGNEINCLDFNLEGGRYATAGKDLDIRIYDVTNNQVVQKYEGYSYITPEQHTHAGHAQRVFALRYHPDNNDVFITGGWDNHLKIWDSRTRDGVQRTVHGPHICGDSLDIKGSQILTGSWVASNALQIWDFTSGQLIQDIPIGHKPSTESVNGSGDGSKTGEFLYCAQFGDHDLILAGGSGTSSAVVISTQTCQVIGEVELGRPVQAMDSTSGGRLLAVGGVGCKLKLAKLL